MIKAIKNAIIYTGESILTDKTIFIKEGKIAEICSDSNLL